MKLTDLRRAAYGSVEQTIGNGAVIYWQVRPVDPLTLFRSETLISALISASADPGSVAADLDEAERLARKGDQSTTDQLADEIDAYQTIARQAVVGIRSSPADEWRPVEWVDSPEEENDIEGGALVLSIGWLSKGALQAVVLQSGLRMTEVTEELRFRGSSEGSSGVIAG